MKNNAKKSNSDKRATIIERAGQLFLKLGFENTSMSQIALHAGVAKQTLYSHFGSKEALFTAAIEEACQRHELTENLFDTNKSFEEVLLAVGNRIAELVLSDESLQLNKICISGSDQYPTVSKLFWEAGPQWLTEQLSSYFEVKALAGEISMAAADTESAAKHFLSLVRGQELQRRLLGLPYCTDDDIDQHIRRSVTFFMKAVAA